MATKSKTNGGEKKPAHRPAKYKTPEDLQAKADEYFEWCEKNEKIPNIAGLCWFCDFADKQSFTDQGLRGPEFSLTVKRVRNRLYAEKFEKAAAGKMNATIFIFDAVNNHDMYNTRTENKNDNKHSGGITLAVTTDDKGCL